MTVRLWNNAGLPTPDCITTFTEGDCWALAMALYELSGGFLRPFLVESGMHWVAGDGQRFLDIEGVHTRRRLLRLWEARSLALASQGLLSFATEDLHTERFEFEHLTYRRVVDAARRTLSAHSERMGL